MLQLQSTLTYLYYMVELFRHTTHSYLIPSYIMSSKKLLCPRQTCPCPPGPEFLLFRTGPTLPSPLALSLPSPAFSLDRWLLILPIRDCHNPRTSSFLHFQPIGTLLTHEESRKRLEQHHFQ